MDTKSSQIYLKFFTLSWKHFLCYTNLIPQEFILIDFNTTILCFFVSLKIMVIVEYLIICAFKISCKTYMVLFIIGYLMILERDTIYGTGVACIFSSVSRKVTFVGQ